jgi:hypothetical protein
MRTHYDLKDRPYDWQDKVIFKGIWLTSISMFLIWIFTA